MISEAAREKNRENCRRWYAANKERQKDKARRRYRENPEAKRESVRRWRGPNPEKAKSYTRRWYLDREFGITPEQYDQMLAAFQPYRYLYILSNSKLLSKQ